MPITPWQFLIECKRVFSPAKVEVRIKEAADQIRRGRRGAVPSTRGVIAISLSPVMNPGAVAYKIANLQEGNRALERWLDGIMRATSSTCEDLFGKGDVVGIFFEAASDFHNLDTQKFDRGRHVTIRTHEPVMAPYKHSLGRMCGEVYKLKTV